MSVILLIVFISVSYLTVLSVESDAGLIPVPKASTAIEAGDRLICYGKSGNLKDFV